MFGLGHGFAKSVDGSLRVLINTLDYLSDIVGFHKTVTRFYYGYPKISHRISSDTVP